MKNIQRNEGQSVEESVQWSLTDSYCINTILYKSGQLRQESRGRKERPVLDCDWMLWRGRVLLEGGRGFLFVFGVV